MVGPSFPCQFRAQFELHPTVGHGFDARELADALSSTEAVSVDHATGQAALDAEPWHLQRHMQLGLAAMQRAQFITESARQHGGIRDEDDAQ
jgi:hypothetical protein